MRNWTSDRAFSLWVCFAVALSARLLFLFVVFPALEPRLGGDYAATGYDADGYGKIAEQILRGEYRDLERAPLYPAFLALLYALLGKSIVVVRIAQALLDVGTVALIARLGRSLAPARPLGAWAAWLYALYPLAWWRCAFVNKEILQTTALVLFVSAFYAAAQSPSSAPRKFFLAGLALGALNLVKPIFLLLPLALSIWFWIQRSPLLRAAAALGAFVAGMGLVILPWTARNYAVSGEFVAVALERRGVTMFVGNYHPNRGAWEGAHKTEWQAELSRIAAEHPQVSPVDLDRLYWRAAMENIARHPLSFAEMFARKLWRFWFANPSGRMGQAVLAVQLLFVGLAAAGLARRVLPGSVALLFLLLIGYVWVLHAVVYAEVRFSLPLMPLLAVCGAAAFLKKDGNDQGSV